MVSGGGYVSGALCAIISNPADNMVSFVNHAKGTTIAEVNSYTFLRHKLLIMFADEMSIFLPDGAEDMISRTLHKRTATKNSDDWVFDGSTVGHLRLHP